MSLTIEQQKELFGGLYDEILRIHMTSQYKNQLKIFTEDSRNKNWKGIVLLDYTTIKEMILSVKNRDFCYQWIPKDEAFRIKHNGITSAVVSMRPKTDCVFVCSLSLSLQHLYINCTKIKDIHV